MNRNEALKWLEELDRGPAEVPSYSRASNDRPRLKWLVESQTALESLFPESHPVRKSWLACFREKHPGEVASHDGIIDELEGVVSAARSIYEGNRLASLVGGIRSETVEELLDQAATLVDLGHVAAGTVVAGGALETHLHFLCTSRQIEWIGRAGINTYCTALASADVVSKTDAKSVQHWGGLRNDAAHTPAKFDQTADAIKLMINGIRLFIVKHKF